MYGRIRGKVADSPALQGFASGLIYLALVPLVTAVVLFVLMVDLGAPIPVAAGFALVYGLTEAWPHMFNSPTGTLELSIMGVSFVLASVLPFQLFEWWGWWEGSARNHIREWLGWKP